MKSSGNPSIRRGSQELFAEMPVGAMISLELDDE
jgi:hypothetical protein